MKTKNSAALIVSCLALLLIAGCTSQTNQTTTGKDQTGKEITCTTGTVRSSSYKRCMPDVSNVPTASELKASLEKTKTGAKYKEFNGKTVSFKYIEDAIQGKDKGTLQEKEKPISGLFLSGARLRLLMRFDTNTSTGTIEEFLQLRYMPGVKNEDKKNCTISSTENDNGTTWLKITPNKDVITDKGDIAKNSRICGPYGSYRNSVFMYNKSNPKKIILVETQSVRNMIDINSISIK